MIQFTHLRTFFLFAQLLVGVARRARVYTSRLAPVLAASAEAATPMSGIVGDDGLTNEERNQCREAFEKFDKDNSGAISDWELKQMLQCAAALSRTRDPRCPRSTSPGGAL